MEHRGEIVEHAVRQSGMAISEVARRLGKSRRHLYNLFDEPNVSLDVILQVGEIIHHNFEHEIPVLESKKTNQETNEVQFPYNKQNEGSIAFWKDKYLRLLEKYNLLLEQVQK